MRLFANIALAFTTIFGLWGCAMAMGFDDLTAMLFAIGAAGFIAPQI